MYFFYFFQIILTFTLGLNGLLLSFKGYNISRYLKYLGANLLAMTLFLLAISFFYDFSLLRSYPHLLVTLSPLNFILVPLFYFSVRSISTGENYFGKKDIIHLIPAILRFIDLIPIYLLPQEDKLAIINKYFPSLYDLSIHTSGFIPGNWSRIICFILMIYYFSKSIKLLFNLPSEILNKFKIEKFNNVLFGTLVAMTIMYACYLVIFFTNAQFYFLETEFANVRDFFYFILFSTILVYDIYLFLKIEFGSNTNSNTESLNTEIDLQSSTLNPFSNYPLDWEDTGLNKLEVESRLNHVLDEKKVFLIKNLTVKDFSIEADLPVRLLPHILNLTFKNTFKELINERRAKFAKEKIESGFLLEFTIDALSIECGFNSRVTFYNAFKKELGLSPNQYWAKIKEESNILN
jgi:AraC-like DNA-binding protein